MPIRPGLSFAEAHALQQANYQRRLETLRAERAYAKVSWIVDAVRPLRAGDKGLLLGWRKHLRARSVDLVW